MQNRLKGPLDYDVPDVKHAAIARHGDVAAIAVSRQMIEAGVTELRQKSCGADLREIVSDVYSKMELERRYQAINGKELT